MLPPPTLASFPPSLPCLLQEAQVAGGQGRWVAMQQFLLDNLDAVRLLTRGVSGGHGGPYQELISHDRAAALSLGLTGHHMRVVQDWIKVYRNDY